MGCSRVNTGPRRNGICVSDRLYGARIRLWVLNKIKALKNRGTIMFKKQLVTLNWVCRKQS
jgi:hypothetical protein